MTVPTEPARLVLPDSGLVLVCGAGVAGAPAARVLLERGVRVRLLETGVPPGLGDLLAAGAELATTLEPAALLDGVDLVVTSPGWRPDNPVLVAAAIAGIEVIGEVEFAWRLRAPGAPPWLAVTGTNGKTTTVRMTASILAAAGLRTAAVGNVGVSVIDAVHAGDDYDVLAVELSSFQLYWSSTVSPLAGAWLNLAPDHLDWHGGLAAYAEAKAKVWAGRIAIGNLDDPEVARRLAGVRDRRVIGFGLDIPAAGQLGVSGGVLVDRATNQATMSSYDDAIALLPTEDVRPPGRHNVANALAAAALAGSVGIGPGVVAAGLRSFRPDPHRNELIATIDGIDYVDDSKATNPHAAAQSLASWPGVVWIAGGQLKGVEVDTLVGEFAHRLRGVVLLGVDRATLAAALARHAPHIPVIEVASTDDRAMTEVVAAARALARPGDTVLLAPAAASLDMYASYAQRGQAFRAAVGVSR